MSLERIFSTLTITIPKINPQYMVDQKELNWKMREILIDWLIEVDEETDGRSTFTIFTAVNILDRYLEKVTVSRTALQTVGCACLAIASKFHNIEGDPTHYSAQLYVTMADNSFSIEKFVQTEKDVLKKVNFDLVVDNPVYHIEKSYDTLSTKKFAIYLARLTLQHYQFIKYTPREIALACLGKGKSVLMEEIDMMYKGMKTSKTQAAYKQADYGPYTHSDKNFEEEEETMFPPNKVYLTFPPISRYKNLKRLGSGAYGTVYRGNDSYTGKIVAIKKSPWDPSYGLSYASIREISLLKEFPHRNIVSLFDVCFEPGYICIIMEYMEGTLSAYIKGKGNDPDKNRKVIEQIIEGVAHLHRKNIIHRDLKPGNILVNNTDLTVKIADFGLARYYNGDKMSTDYFTIWWRPPEIMLGETDYTKTSDCWSLGCIIAHIINGKLLFSEETEESMIDKIFELFPTPESDYYEDLPGWNNYERITTGKDIREIINSSDETLINIVKKLLDTDPNTRMTAEEALEMIKKV